MKKTLIAAAAGALLAAGTIAAQPTQAAVTKPVAADVPSALVHEAAALLDFTDTGGTLNDVHKTCNDNLNNCLWIHVNGAYDIYTSSSCSGGCSYSFRFARLWGDWIQGYPSQFKDAQMNCSLYDGGTGYGLSKQPYVEITYPGDSIKAGPDPTSGGGQVRGGKDGNFRCFVGVDWMNGSDDHFTLYGHMN